MADTIHTVVAEHAIRRVMTLYCRAADRRDHALMRSILHDDAFLDLGHFRGGADQFIAYAAAFPPVGSSQHHITNLLVEIDGDHAEAETYCVAIHGGLPYGAARQDCTVFVRYLDQFERRDGQWRISRHVVVWDWNQNVPSTDCWTGPLHGHYSLRPTPGRDDLSYAELPLIGGFARAGA